MEPLVFKRIGQERSGAEPVAATAAAGRNPSKPLPAGAIGTKRCGARLGRKLRSSFGGSEADPTKGAGIGSLHRTQILYSPSSSCYVPPMII